MPELYHTEQLSLPVFKYCPSCNRDDKLLLDFHSDTSKPDGHYPICKDCINKRRRELRQNPELSQRPKPPVKPRKGYRICRACGKEKLMSECIKNANHCKDCDREYHHNYHIEYMQTEHGRKIKQDYPRMHKDKMHIWGQRNYLNHRAARCEKDARRYARKFNIPLERVDYETILKRDGLHCHICDGDILDGKYHFDHVIPLARGGTHSEENIKIAHKICNLRKGTKLMEELTSRDRRGIAA